VNPLKVYIAENDDIGDLKYEIKVQKPATFVGIDVDNIIIWKVSDSCLLAYAAQLMSASKFNEPVLIRPEQTVASRIRGFGDDPLQFATRLESSLSISKIFSPASTNHIDILVTGEFSAFFCRL
jgi:hypothetical protein